MPGCTNIKQTSKLVYQVPKARLSVSRMCGEERERERERERPLIVLTSFLDPSPPLPSAAFVAWLDLFVRERNYLVWITMCVCVYQACCLNCWISVRPKKKSAQCSQMMGDCFPMITL